MLEKSDTEEEGSVVSKKCVSLTKHMHQSNVHDIHKNRAEFIYQALDRQNLYNPWARVILVNAKQWEKYKQWAHYKPALLLTHARTELAVMLHFALPLGCKGEGKV